jgi:hypothetical protein
MSVDMRRRYRCRRVRLAVEPFGALIVFLGLVLAVGNRPPLPIRLAGAAGILIGLSFVWWGRRIGVDIDGSTVTVRSPMQVRVSRDDILGVGTRRWFANRVIYVELRDGRRLDTSLIQGASVTWAGGETHDILAVLAEELQLPSKTTQP